MPISVRFSTRFERRLGKLARRFPSVTDDVGDLVGRLRQGERPGFRYRRMGGRVYRVRLSNRSAGRGKRAGFRVAYYVANGDTVTLLAICDRKDCAELQEGNLRSLMRKLGL